MKKWLAFILAGMMLLTSVAALAEEDEVIFDEDDFTGHIVEEWVYTGPEYDYDHLVAGNTTALSGGFSNQLWGSNTSDLDVSALVNGYNLMKWSYDLGGFVPDETVVSYSENLTVADDEEGNRTYFLPLADDLYYSDGTKITAYDYAFNVLLSVSAQAKELGANTNWYPSLKGMEAYKNGEKKALEGLSVASENMLAFTVAAEYRPFFYELGLLLCYPMPIDVIAPGCKVVDDGEGCYIEGEFTADVLKKTMLDPENGYRTFPSVVSGPYKLTSFDGVTAEFEMNPYYKGNSEGIQPTIPHLTYTLADNDTMMSDLEAGKFGLINKALKADAIDKGMEIVSTGNFGMTSYARIGQSHISFCTEKAAVNSQAVRQAIALCMDKDQLVADYSGNYGIRVDGYYGIGQWMFRVLSGALGAPVVEPAEDATKEEIKEYEEAVKMWEELLETVSAEEFKKYDLDVEAAVKLLEEDGWKLNANGEVFQAGTDTVRCKEIDGQLVALDLTMIYPEGNEIASFMEETFVNHLAEAGIRLTLKPVEMNELRSILHRDVERDVDMVYIATNFDEVFNPMPTFDPADAEIGRNNYTAIQDQELYDLAKDMCMTEPGDVYTYFVKWMAFQDKFMDVLPELPVYGNAYFDFYTACLQDYLPSESVKWSEAVVPAFMGDPMMIEEEAAEEGTEDENDLVSFDD